ncbi:hypothetical protein CEXT_738531 [Caerostris extrusa]|uniref:Uncharacterized protein n=1 Tax=Caerostris extrusa TaxID=172846 RepID=A0AAV4SU84_CAEEX|nr:hypothetical protein CEXT_738531 [Caerostris extrusa]
MKRNIIGCRLETHSGLVAVSDKRGRVGSSRRLPRLGFASEKLRFLEFQELCYFTSFCVVLFHLTVVGCSHKIIEGFILSEPVLMNSRHVDKVTH